VSWWISLISYNKQLILTLDLKCHVCRLHPQSYKCITLNEREEKDFEKKCRKINFKFIDNFSSKFLSIELLHMI